MALLGDPLSCDYFNHDHDKIHYKTTDENRLYTSETRKLWTHGFVLLVLLLRLRTHM